MRIRLILIFSMIFTTALTWAGGPLQIWNDQAVVWDSSTFPVPYHLDQGALGPFSAEEAKSLIEQAFALWSRVATSSISFMAGGAMPIDIDGANYLDYIDGRAPGFNPIIFDDDGGITEAVFGQNAQNDILGFASITESNETTILSSQVVFNGAYLTAQNISAAAYQATILHELGHWIGLDHSQLLRHIANDGVGSNDVWTPIMFPTTTDDETQRTLLTDDDQWALSNLYPRDGFHESTGSIRGLIQQYTEEKPGLNVIARRVGHVTDHIYSTVSGAFDTLGGSFEFNGLPVGDYQVYIEPVDLFYRGSSSVGRYAATFNSLSFRDPPPAQYFHTGDDRINRSRWTPISVEANSTNNEINFDLNFDIASFDENDSQLFGLPDEQIGAAPPNASTRYQYIMTLGGNETAVEIKVNSAPDSLFDLLVGMERRPGAFDLPTASSVNGNAKFLLTPSSDPPLQIARYFIAVRNRSEVDAPFTLTTQTPTANTRVDYELYR
ncbi:MAG: M43 family zinc metalloprotease [Candidatus Hinthialibacter antarcticus]|nr:M43 family zinc metalloprotease [Candidatus Hinthialibacter antarcticus]